MEHESSIATTNDLVVHVFDSIDGYRTAAQNSTNERLAQSFATLSEQRVNLASEMQAHVRTLGGKPEDEGSLSGMAHRGFLKLRDAISGQDDNSVLAEVDRGEDFLKQRFIVALENDRLEPNSRARIAQWRERILEDHRSIQQWRAFAA